MSESTVGRILWLAVNNPDFRKRLIGNLGTTLAEEGFIVSDGEMAVLRDCHESVRQLDDRRAFERIHALARLRYSG